MLIFRAEKSVFFIWRYQKNFVEMHAWLFRLDVKENLSGKQTERFKHIFTHLETVYCLKCGFIVFKGYVFLRGIY